MVQHNVNQTVLAFLAKRLHGSMARAAVAIGVHPNTLYSASAGVGVSAATRLKIEAEFSAPLAELQRPLESQILVP
jgi:hypothetical protein